MPIIASEFDRLVEQGRDGRYFAPISEAEFQRQITASKKAG